VSDESLTVQINKLTQQKIAAMGRLDHDEAKLLDAEIYRLCEQKSPGMVNVTGHIRDGKGHGERV